MEMIIVYIFEQLFFIYFFIVVDFVIHWNETTLWATGFKNQYFAAETKIWGKISICIQAAIYISLSQSQKGITVLWTAIKLQNPNVYIYWHMLKSWLWSETS